MDHEEYKRRVLALVETYPVGMAFVIFQLGVPPLPPPEIPDIEIEDDLAQLENVCILAEARMGL